MIPLTILVSLGTIRFYGKLGSEVCFRYEASFYEITEVKPLNNATPHALFIDLGASASDVWVVNDGYWE